MSTLTFKERVAVITGAGGGLGKSYALELARRGVKVVVNDLGGARDGTGSDKSAADEVVDEIKTAGGEAVPNYDSVATLEGGKNIIKTAVENYGKVDILINNAGILRDKSFLNTSEEEYDIVVSVHQKGAYCVTQPAFAVMKENNYGRIMNTTSGAGLYGNFGQTNYSMAKTSLLGLMHSINVEGAKYNIKCNTLAPLAASRLNEDIFPPEAFKIFKPEFVTPLVVYLVSDENKDFNMIFNAGAGWFSRSAIVCAPGVTIGDTVREITAEEIQEKWSEIISLDKAKPLNNVSDTNAFMLPLLN